MGPLVWRLLGTGTAALAGLAANQVATQIWRRAGRDNRIDPRNPEVPVVEALAFAALTGLVAGTVRVLATRKAAEFYARSAGHLPKEMQQGEA